MTRGISKATVMIVILCAALVGAITLLPHAVVTAKGKTHQWQKGMLLDVTQRDASRLINGTSYDKIIWTYTIDDGHYVWKLDRDTNHRDKPLDITINSPVEFAVEGQKAYLKDDSGQEHNLSVEAKALKTPPTQ